MALVDKTLTCVECGASFVFTVGEQEFYATRGFTNEPRRCSACRQSRRSGSGSDSYGSRPSRTMYTVTCDACGAQTQVPFQPRGDKPVYCEACYAKVRSTR